MGDISELIGRLEKLTGPSGAIDAELYATVGGAPHTTTAGGRTIPLIEIGDPSTWPPYTASLDAAIALVERLLPGWQWMAGTTHAEFLNAGEHRFNCDLAGPISYYRDEDGYEDLHYKNASARGCNAAVATCLALLKAKQGESDAG